MFVLFSGQWETSENCKQGSQMIRFGIFERSPRRSIHTQLHPPTLKVGLCSYPDAENDFFFQEPEIREVVHAQGGEGTSSPCVGVTPPATCSFVLHQHSAQTLAWEAGEASYPLWTSLYLKGRHEVFWDVELMRADTIALVQVLCPNYPPSTLNQPLPFLWPPYWGKGHAQT